MSNRETVRVLADDLTGALDSAAAFASSDQPFPVVWDSGSAPEGSGAVELATREAGEADAIARHELCAAWLADAQIPFKKVDSLLRGYPAAEIAACIRGGAYDRVVIAPAFPFQRRATRAGRQWTHDSSKPVGPDLVAELARHDVPAGAASDLNGAAPVTICDADTDADLDRIVRSRFRSDMRTLWVGAGGLAAALARRFAPDCGVIVPAGSLEGPLLGLIGTNHPVTLAQLDKLRGTKPDAVLVVAGADAAPLVQARWREHGLAVVHVDAPTDRVEAAKRIARAFAELLAALKAPGSLFVTGGETLHDVATALGAHALNLFGAIEPGLPVSRLVGGCFDGIPVISKSGGFGRPNLLRELADAIKIEVAHI